ESLNQSTVESTQIRASTRRSTGYNSPRLAAGRNRAPRRGPPCPCTRIRVMPHFPFVRLAAALTVLAACAVAGPAARADYSDELYKVDVKLLEDAKVPHGDTDLIEFFQKRLLKDSDR